MDQNSTDLDLCALAIEKFKSGDYPEEIEAFNKSLALHEQWHSYQGLGWALHLTHQHQQAIEAFNKSLALHENWQSYNGLGCALGNTQQYQQAIEAFNKSLALHEHWHSYQGLGCALGNTQQYQQALEAFNKSLALHEHWHSYQGLGRALGNTQQHLQAIEAFNKSLALHENWESYQGLGWALHLTQQNQPAIEAFNKSLALHENWESYKGLGWALGNTQQHLQAIEAFNKSLALHENWESYQGLGRALLLTQQHLQAIEPFKKSLALHENWESYKGLGCALFHTQQYQQAIEAFNKALALHEDWQSWQGLGSALSNTQQYQQAIEAFNKSLALHENWESYQGLGRALLLTQQHLQAIEPFKKSLALHENWESYKGLGWALHLTHQYLQAIEPFKKSLALHEHWQSYQGLGSALFLTQQHLQAIEAFNKSLALHENWESYQGLGRALHLTHQHQQAIEAFNKSLALHENWQSYQGLGSALFLTQQHLQAIEAFNKAKSTLVSQEARSIDIEKSEYQERVEQYKTLASNLHSLGKIEHATRAQQIYYRQSNAHPHKRIDPFLGEKSGVAVTRDLIEGITENLSRIQIAFHHSYCLGEKIDDELQSWKHLIFIHIPKCAGTNFEAPLAKILEHIELKNQDKIRPTNAACKHYLWHGNLGDKFKHDAYLLEAFQGKALNDLQGSFFANHDGKHGTYNQNLREAGISAKKICLVRDPYQRLYSHIRHHWRNQFDKSTLLSKYSKQFSNLMDRCIYDYNLFDGYNESPYCDPFDYEKCETIDFLDISDDHAISKVKSSFLSATLLPNIVQYNRLNDDNNKIKVKGALGEKDFQDIHKELISLGFLDRDNQIDLEFLKKRTKERLVFPEIIHKGSVLHPITFVYSRNGAAKLMLTKDFIADPLNAINC